MLQIKMKKSKRFEQSMQVTCADSTMPSEKMQLNHIQKIIDTYKDRKSETRYIATGKPEEEIHLDKVHSELALMNDRIEKARKVHNGFLKELGLKNI